MDERAERIATIVAEHTKDVSILAVSYAGGQIMDEAFGEQLQARCMRTTLALLACVHADGPP